MVKTGIKVITCLGLLLQSSVGLAVSSETLSYRVYYKGLLSAMQALPIAEARLTTEHAQQGLLEVSTLTLSSAAHDVVDAVYPIRYRLRALYHLQDQRLLGMERFKQTRKIKHDVAWVDSGADQLHYLRVDKRAAPIPLPPTLQPWLGQQALRGAPSTVTSAPLHLLDRLSLLQSLRREIPAVGQVRALAVTDGPKAYGYQVRLDGTENVTIGGRSWSTWRLRVDGYEKPATGPLSASPDHAPIYVWVSRDASRLPLRFRIDHSVGDFTVEWVPDELPVDLALDVPADSGGSWADDS